jgi:hypothetical protein
VIDINNPYDLPNLVFPGKFSRKEWFQLEETPTKPNGAAPPPAGSSLLLCFGVGGRINPLSCHPTAKQNFRARSFPETRRSQCFRKQMKAGVRVSRTYRVYC